MNGIPSGPRSKKLKSIPGFFRAEALNIFSFLTKRHHEETNKLWLNLVSIKFGGFVVSILGLPLTA